MAGHRDDDRCDAMVAGHLCLDILPALPASGGGWIDLAPGRLVEVGPAVLATGGPVSNTGLALHILGISTRLVGKVSCDVFGAAIRIILASRAPELVGALIEADGETSSYSVILSRPGTDRTILHCSGCNDTFAADDVDDALFRSARLFHFGYPPIMRRMMEGGGAELVELFHRAKDAGCTTSLDMTMPDPNGPSGRADWRAILEAALPYVDLYLPSMEETLFMLRPDRYRTFQPDEPDPELVRDLARELLQLGPAAVGLKLGAHGLYLATAARSGWSERGRAAPLDEGAWIERELWSPCFEVAVAGTTGAGDATIAGFLAALLRGAAPEESVTMACAVGACNVEAPDATGGVRGWDETLARRSGGWARRRPPLDARQWRMLEPSGVWSGPDDRAAPVRG
jgi:sugar/nucleoside kinase (ribokinase family)